MTFDPNALGEPVRSVQRMLRLLAQDSGVASPLIPDGIYGKQTLRSVSEFQKQNGLPVTGVVNEITWQKIYQAYRLARIRQGPAAPLEIVLGPGQRISAAEPSVHIWLIQTMLHILSLRYENFPAVNINGEYDAATGAAINALQQYADLPVEPDGAMDKRTWQYLTHMYRSATIDAPVQNRR